jgi:hypothetical protein
VDELGVALQTLKVMGLLDRIEELSVGSVRVRMCNVHGVSTAREATSEEIQAARDAVQFAASGS